MKPLGRRTRRAVGYLRTVDLAEAALTLSSIVDLIVIDRCLRSAGYEASLTRIARRHRLHSLLRKVPPATVARAVYLATRVALPGDGPCLRRAILLTWLLRSADVPCDLIAGVGRSDGEWAGHAWVEVDGRPLRESADVAERYTLFRDPLSSLAGTRAGNAI